MTLSHTVGPTCADESKKPGVTSLKPFLPLQLQCDKGCLQLTTKLKFQNTFLHLCGHNGNIKGK